MVRAALMAVFFMYEADVFGKNDLFIVGFMCVFAFASGLLVVYSYVSLPDCCLQAKQNLSGACARNMRTLAHGAPRDSPCSELNLYEYGFQQC